MIDYSKYNQAEMQAIVTVLDDLTDEMSVQQGYENDFHLALAEYMRANARATDLINQQARDAAEAAEDPPASAPPAEEPDRKFNVQALVDGLSWCSDCCNALVIGEVHFSVCSQMEVFNKVTMLQDCKRALNNMVSEIRDHYDGLH